MKLTIKQINEFSIVGSAYMKDHNNKLSYAIRKVNKNITSVVESINENIEDLRIEHCSVDEKGNVLKDEKGNYKFSKDGLRALAKAVKELNNKIFEIEPFFATEIPDDLTEEQKEIFTGLVIE